MPQPDVASVPAAASVLAAAAVVAACIERGLTVATGESLTAGLVASTIADIPGCSAMLRGSIVAYHIDLKRDLLGVSDADLAHGLVSREVAVAMARGAATALSADIGIGTTGVAGPDPHDGTPAGSAWIAVTSAAGVRAVHLRLGGGREEIRRQTVAACLTLVGQTLRE